MNVDGILKDAHDDVDISSEIKSNIQSFISLFESSAHDLQKQVDDLLKITIEMENNHRLTTVGSLSGGFIGAAGGIAAIAGLALSSVTFGTSLIIGGFAVSLIGGATGAASNVAGMILNKSAREKIETITNIFCRKLSPLIEKVNAIRNYIEVIKNSDPLEENSEIFNVQLSGARVAGGIAAGLLKRIGLAKIDKVGALMSKTINIAGKLSGVLSGLFLIFDMFSIYKEATEISEIYQLRNKREINIQSETLTFIQEMRNTANQFQVTVNDLKQVKHDLERDILNNMS